MLNGVGKQLEGRGSLMRPLWSRGLESLAPKAGRQSADLAVGEDSRDCWALIFEGLFDDRKRAKVCNLRNRSKTRMIYGWICCGYVD